MSKDNRDDEWMQEALRLAQRAADKNEVPVGAVVVLNNEIIGRGYNQPISSCDPSAHAEIVALRDAATSVGNYRLPEACLYVTLEPCTMCVGAIVHSRIKRLVYGAKEPKAGVVESQANLLERDYLNHCVEHRGGVLQQSCSKLLSDFFARRREDKKNKTY